MKKLIYLAVAVMTAFCCSACNSCTNDNGESFGIEFSLMSEGKTDGSVSMTFVNGNFHIAGDASYDFAWSNGLKMEVNNEVISLNDALASNDVKVQETAEKVNNWLNESIEIKDAEGHYDIYVRGYVMETFTHLKFEIDRHFTNNPTE